MKKLLLLPFFVLSLWAHGQYDPSKATVTNKPLGVAQGVPTDARSYYYSPSLFIWRPYQSTAEVLSSLNIAKFRMGNFPIYVNVGGTLNSNGTFTGGTIKEYWFRDGTSDVDLVEKFSAAAGETLSGTIAQLRALTTGTGKVYTSTDRGGGSWVDEGLNDGTQTDDGAIYIITANGHRLHRQNQSPIDVAWFGAKTDGTDASAAVQAAINSLPSTGGEIYFPATGEYKILSKINITKNFVTIRGGGAGTVIRNAGNNYAFEVTGQYVTIKDVSIWGYGGALGAGANANNKGIYFNSGNNFVLDRVVIRYHGGHGVVCNNGVWIGSFVSSELEHNGGDGLNSISPTGLGSNQNGNAFSFTNCTIAYNNGNGINWKATTLNITGCTIEGNRGRGLYFNCTGLTNSIYNINVTGNYFESNILGEIEFVSDPSTIIYNANVENNEFFSVSTASTAFVKFSGASYVNKNCKVGKNAYTFAGTVIHAVDGGETFSRSCFVDDALFEGNDIDDRFVNLGFAKTSVAADGMIIRSSDYTINKKDFGIGSNGLLTVYGDASNGSINITLPLTTDMVNRTVKVIKIDGSPNTVTVHAGGSELLNSGANDVLSEIYQSGEYKSSGIFGKIFKTIETSPTAILKFGNQSSTGVKTFNGGNPIIINGNTMEYKNNDTSYWGTGITGEAGKKDYMIFNSRTNAIDLRVNSLNDKASFWSTVSGAPAEGNNEFVTLSQLNAAAGGVYTVAGMRAATTTTKTLYTTTDLGGGTWLDLGLNDGTNVDNSGTILITANGHTLKRQFEGAVNVKWFGAKGDGVNDDTGPIQSAINYVLGGNVASGASTVHKAKNALFFPNGKFRITSTIKVYSVEFLRIYGDINSTLYVDANMQTAFDLNGIAYSTIENLRITGNASSIVDYGMFVHWNSSSAMRSTTQNTFRNIFILELNYKTGFKAGNITGGGVQVDNSDYYHIDVTGGWTSETANIETVLWQTGIEVGDGTFGNNLLHNFYYLASVGNRNGLFVNATQAAVHGGTFDLAENSILLLSSGYFFAQGIRVEHSQRLLKTSTTGNIPCVARLSDVDYHGEFIHPDGNWIYYTLAGSLILDNVSARQVGLFSGVTTAKVFVYALKTSLNVRGLNVQLMSSTSGLPLADAFDLASTVDAVISGYSSLDINGDPVNKQQGVLQVSAGGISSSLSTQYELNTAISPMMRDTAASTKGSLKIGFVGEPNTYHTDITHRVIEAGHVATDFTVKNAGTPTITTLSIDNITGKPSFSKSVDAARATQPTDLLRKDQMDSAYDASAFAIINAAGAGDTVMTATSNTATFKRVIGGNGISISSDANSMTISSGGGTVRVLPNADYTITTSDHTLILTEVAANRTVTLPAASTMPNKEINLSVRATTTGRWLLSGSFVQKSTVGANPISENFVNSGLPNGLNYRLVSDGVKWYDINN